MTRPSPPWFRVCSPVATAIVVARRSSDISARRPTVVRHAVSGTNTHVGFTVIQARSVCANFLQHIFCAVLGDVLPYSVRKVRFPAHRPPCMPILPDVGRPFSRARSPSANLAPRKWAARPPAVLAACTNEGLADRPPCCTYPSVHHSR